MVPDTYKEADVSTSFCSYGDDAARDSFNPYAARDYSKIAVSLTGFSDGSSHVGYYDVDSQQIVDLTAARQAPSAFTSNVQNEVEPVFFSSDILRFLSGAKVVSTGIWTGGKVKAVSVSHPAKLVSDPDPAKGREFVAVGVFASGAEPDASKVDTGLEDLVEVPGGKIVPTEWVVSASGNRAADHLAGGESDGDTGIINSGSNSHWPSAKYVSYKQIESLGTYGVWQKEVLPPEVAFWAANHCGIPLAWVDDDHFITDSIQIGSVNLNAHTVECTNLLPANSRVNENAILAPDRGSVLFTSTQGSQRALYRTGLKPGKEPVKVVDLPEEWEAPLGTVVKRNA
ncbi:hypothetical protein [Streptomyces sp. NPDC005262]|uniref:hypothetical protein n=1 Tax=Streptomyces sp. NPDC005262 TaxID=3364710 RepID=UPI0036873BF6